MRTEDYFLGLDMGTSSVGWAVTNDKYELLKAKGKDLWGIREFDEAKTSVERRTNRISRRRLQREKVRIGLIKDYFADAIKAVDPNFYVRMENSKYHIEDKDEIVRYKYGLFNDEGFTDKEYYEQYPTIFHLRKELIENENAPYDVRLVFLAVLNLFKRRGHFLNASLSGDGETRSLTEVYGELCEQNMIINGKDDDKEFLLQSTDISKLEKILVDKNLSRTEKKDEICSLLNVGKNKRGQEYVKAICGLAVDLEVLFSIEEQEKKIKFSFTGTYEDEKDQYYAHLTEEEGRFIELLKEIYDISSLAGIMKGHSYLSFARVDEYKKHQKDLVILKRLMKKYCDKNRYDDFFRSEKPGTYSAYVNSYNTQKKESDEQYRRNYKDRKKDNLYGEIKKILKAIEKNAENDTDYLYVKEEIDKESFLPKQLTSANGVIPNQVHAKELRIILENAKEYLPFLKDVDEESGMSVADRIISLFEFQIPYYIGPVTENSQNNKGNGWVIRKESGKVLPWNIDKKIDIAKTSEEFIGRLIRKCTYLSDERVMPKASLLYEKYKVLNEINALSIDGKRIPVKLKQEIYHDLYENGKVTKNKLVNYLTNRGLIEEMDQLSGVDKNLNNQLSSYAKFLPIFGEKMKEDKYWNLVESIIYWGTIYGDSKKMFGQKLREELEKNSVKIDEAGIKRIMGYKFSDWGNLSKEFLCLKGYDKSTGVIKSLISALWDSENNMMELLNSTDYTFGEELKEKEKSLVKSLSEFNAEDLKDYYFSAPVKRMIWQTLLIIKELEKILGKAPKRIFVEMTRSDEEKGDKGRKASRKDKLLEAYKSIKDTLRTDWKELIEKSDENGTIKSKKMYLYLMQMGRSMYTGKPIDLEYLFDENRYDIDHIYPRHFVKDDNIGNNLVLVEKEINAHKLDVYPLETGIRNNPDVTSLWRTLKENKLLSDEKYKRLISDKGFTEEEQAGFIARQLVETAQGTKGVTDLLKQLLPETEFVYSKAKNVSEFRQKFNFAKSRLVNDFHHAHDAYLNIVVGNTYYVKFTKDPRNFIREYKKDSESNRYNLNRMFDWNVRRGVETAWVASTKGESGTIQTVKKMLSRNTPLLTRMNLCNNRQIVKEILHHKCVSIENTFPLKTKDLKLIDVSRYGGYKTVFAACFFLVEHTYKNNRIRTIEAVPRTISTKIENDESLLLDYCEKTLGMKEPSIRLSKIKIQSLFEINGYRVHLLGKNGGSLTLNNAVSLCLNNNSISYIHKLEKTVSEQVIVDGVTVEKNLELYNVIVDKNNRGVFSHRPTFMGKTFENGTETFSKLELLEQCDALIKILKVLSIGNGQSNLKAIGGKEKSGTITTNKKINGNESFRLINQSVTGIYENSIDLLTV